MFTFEAIANIDSTQIFIVLAFLSYVGILDLGRRFSRFETKFVDEEDIEDEEEIDDEEDEEEIDDEEEDVEDDDEYYREGWEDVLNEIEALRED